MSNQEGENRNSEMNQAPQGSQRQRRITGFLSTTFNYLFSNREYTDYQNPAEYESEVLDSWSKRANLACGVADVVEANANRYETKNILDIGAGTGILSLELARRGLTVTALDLFPQQLERLREKATRDNLENRITTVQANMNEPLPIPDASFDLVVSLRATRYIIDFDRFLGEVMRVLESGGTFVLPIFQIDAIPWKRHSRKGILQETGLRGMSERITHAGFEIDQEASRRYLQAVDLERGQRDVPFYYRPTFIVARKPALSS